MMENFTQCRNGRTISAANGKGALPVWCARLRGMMGLKFENRAVWARRLTLTWLTFAGVCCAMVSEAQSIVKDINTLKIVEGSDPSGFAEMNGKVYFRARSAKRGVELWSSDGTEAGTVLVKELCPGAGSAFPSHENLVVMNNTLYFLASHCTFGWSLWKSDGTEAGTVMVVDIFPGNGIGGTVGSGSLTHINGFLYFFAGDGTSVGMDQVLWKSDGTTDGSVPVTTKGQVGFIRNLTDFNGTLVFGGTDGIHGLELWKTDGTGAGTVMVKDINVGMSTDHSDPRDFAVLGNKLYFSARIGMEHELWQTDGTTAGTVMVKDINPAGGSSPSNLCLYNGLIYFAANDGVNGESLWKTDGTSGGTVIVKALSGTSGIKEVNGRLYFAGNDGINGYELWKSDGTEAGTVMIKDVHTGDSGFPGYLTEVNGALFFAANSQGEGWELWKSDGTTTGTVLVKDILPGAEHGDPNSLINIGGTLYFSADDGVSGSELWKSDGTEAGTLMVKDIFSQGVASHPGQLLTVGHTIYFTADDGVSGVELWKTDGSVAGTVMVKDINPGTASASPETLTNVNGTLYFTAVNGTLGRELWRSDGTEAGTVIVKDIGPGANSSGIFSIADVNGMLYFAATDNTHGHELWKSDGTAAGTVMIKDIVPGFAVGSMPTDLVHIGSATFFIAARGDTGRELWKSDGTEAGTVLVKDIRPGTADADIADLTVLDGVLYFSASNGTHGSELWRSDGTEAGTYMVGDMHPGVNSFLPQNLVVMNGALFFSAFHPTVGLELLRTDGTVNGTVVVKDIRPGGTYSRPKDLTVVNGMLYFIVADGPGNNDELWVSDGTEAGTRLIKDIRTGTESSEPQFFKNVNGTLYFVADDGVTGRQLWKSDGLACSTVPVTDIPDGGVEEAHFESLNGKLFFAAEVYGFGMELFVHNTADEQPACTQSITLDEIPLKKYLDAPFTLTASASSGLSVLFSSEDPEIASVNDNVITIHKAGAVTITATQAGDRIFIPASASTTLQISKATQIITFNALPDTRLSDEALTLQATASSGLPVSYISSHPDIASIDGNRITFHKAGMIAIAANQEGNANYEAATQVSQTLAILKIQQSIAFGELSAKMLGEAPFTLSATASSSLSVVFESSDPTVATVTGNTVTIVGAGTTTITASQPGNDVFEQAEPVHQTLNVQLVTDLGEAPGDALVKIFPNPVHDAVNITIASAGTIRVEMFDAMGRVVARETSSGEDVALRMDHLQPGVYHLKVSTARQVVTRQIVKK